MWNESNEILIPFSRLQKRIEEHDAEIEKMCNHHYQGFIVSVKHLLHVKTDATQLKSDVVKIDSDLRESACSSVARANELVKAGVPRI